MSGPFTVRRLSGNPILYRDANPGVGRNINGPSLIEAPPWLTDPLGRYYLYFAHHRGTFIRLATADELCGPWAVYGPGTLQLSESLFPTEGRRPHIASPDVHVDPETQTVRMYYHGLDTATRLQHTRVALSKDGINFKPLPELLGRPYFRVFRHDGWWYAIGMPGILYRSADGLTGFEQGPRLFERSMRHTALLVRDGELLVFWSRVGDTPERILCSRIALDGEWRNWRAGAAVDVLAPELPWEGAELPIEPSVRGWKDEPVHQLRDPAIYQENGRTHLLYSVAGESGIAIAELDVPARIEPSRGAKAREAMTRLVQRVDPGLTQLRQSVVTMLAVLASFATALLIRNSAHLSTSVIILAVALAFSLGRGSRRHGPQRGIVRWLALLVVPLVAVGANEIGTRMLEHPNLGDTLFVLAVSATIWVRRFGPLASRLAVLATLPLIAMLVAPVGIGFIGHGRGMPADQRWWAAVIALVALAWVNVTQLIADRVGFTSVEQSELAPTRAEPARPTGGGKRRRLPASTRMALQMAVALGAAFAVGRGFYASHWTWVVLTAFIVCSGNRGRGDVVHKALMRLLGAGVGTLTATVVSGLVPAGNDWSIAAIFAVLAVALWLRARNYAYWAAGVTASLALLYGYYGERGVGLLGDRLEEIAVGALISIAASWLLLPVRTTDVVRRDLARALNAQSEAEFLHATRELERIRKIMRLLPRRLQGTEWPELERSISGLPPTLTATVPAPDRLWAPTERILGFVNRKHATRFRLVERIADELESLAYLVEDPAGQRAILQWSRIPDEATEAGGPLATGNELAAGRTPSGYPYRLLESSPS